MTGCDWVLVLLAMGLSDLTWALIRIPARDERREEGR